MATLFLCHSLSVLRGRQLAIEKAVEKALDETAAGDEAAKRIRVGRMIVCFVIFLLLVMTAITFAVRVKAVGTTGLGSHGFRAAVFVALCVFLYRGHEWASMTLALASAYGGVAGLISAMNYVGTDSGAASLLVLGMALAYLVCAGLLFFASPVKAFLRHQLPLKRVG